MNSPKMGQLIIKDIWESLINLKNRPFYISLDFIKSKYVEFIQTKPSLKLGDNTNSTDHYNKLIKIENKIFDDMFYIDRRKNITTIDMLIYTVVSTYSKTQNLTPQDVTVIYMKFGQYNDNSELRDEWGAQVQFTEATKSKRISTRPLAQQI